MKLQRTQRGAILVTCILILLVLTVIGVTAMQMTRMQERMAGNSRDTSLAFQGAEAALRDAELQLFNYTSEPVKCTDVNAVCATYFERDMVADMAAHSADWWEDKAQQYGDDSTKEMTDLAEDPRFASEEYAVDWGGKIPSPGEPPTRLIYQVTARSTGGSGEAGVVLQTTYSKPGF